MKIKNFEKKFKKNMFRHMTSYDVITKEEYAFLYLMPRPKISLVIKNSLLTSGYLY
jgi:hypothetical protein